MVRIASWGRVSFGMLACLAACAGSKRSAAPPQEPAATTVPATSDAAEGLRSQKSAVSPATQPPPASSPAAAPPAEGAAHERPPPIEVGSSSPGKSISEEFTRRPEAADPHGASGARVRLAEARREFEIAASERDCARACRALESMERAAQQVCELARSPEERRECTSAGEQVDKARSKVQSACGGCPQKMR